MQTVGSGQRGKPGIVNDDNRIDFPKAAVNDATRVMPEHIEVMPTPELLMVPERFQSVDDVLACAGKLALPNVLVLAVMDNDNPVLLHQGLDRCEMNFLLDRIKLILLDAVQFEKVK